MGLQDRDWYHEAIAEKSKKKSHQSREFKKLISKKKRSKTGFKELLFRALLILGACWVLIQLGLKLKG